MPLIKSAIKQMKQDQRRYAQNLRTKRAMRAAIKAFQSSPSFSAMCQAQSAIDTAAKKNVISKQAAARRIKHLAKLAKESGVKIPAKAPAKTKATGKEAGKPTSKAKSAKATTSKASTKVKAS